MTLRLHTLTLSHFRNYTALRLSPDGARCVILTGANGAGKTNLLEAVSLLTPGRGLRGADLGDIQNTASKTQSFAVSAELDTLDGTRTRLGTGLSRDQQRRIIRINGKDAKTQNDLAPLTSAIWLTPQLDGLFLSSPGQRRKFFDRMAACYIPAHHAHVSRHDRNLRARMKLLTDTRPADPTWLDTLERQIAADAVAIAAGRMQVMEHLQSRAYELKAQQSLFPMPILSLTGESENKIHTAPALSIEDDLVDTLHSHRHEDARTGRASGGAHRCDLEVFYDSKDMPARFCSTGEQKGLLIAIMLAHALMMQAEKGYIPLILLDEVAAHLDENRRAQLFEFFQSMNGQIWLTGTDANIFASLNHATVHFDIRDHYAHPVPPSLKAVS